MNINDLKIHEDHGHMIEMTTIVSADSQSRDTIIIMADKPDGTGERPIGTFPCYFGAHVADQPNGQAYYHFFVKIPATLVPSRKKEDFAAFCEGASE